MDAIAAGSIRFSATGASMYIGAWPYIEILKIDKRPEIDMRGLALWSNR